MSDAAPETPVNPFMQQPAQVAGQVGGQQQESGEAGDGTDEDQQDTTDWKAEARKHEKRAKENAAAAKRARELEAELNQYREASQSETERAISAARREAEKETAARYTRQLATAEVRAAAGGKLQDPNDAVRLIDLDDHIGQDGSVNTDSLRDAIDQLIKEKPYLGIQKARPASFDGGQRAGSAPANGDDFNASLRNGFRNRR